MKFEIKKATKAQSKARVALMGPPGSGKTFSALNMAQYMGERVILIDTERGSASKYAGEFDFQVIELDSFSPRTYVAAIHAAEMAGADVIIIDSLSHAWIGRGGALEMVDKAASGANKNKFTAWKEVTPLQNELIDTILWSKAHVFVTLRTKTDYVIEEDERGRKVPRKVGLGAVQRENIEYEFDIVGVLDMDNNLQITKTRCRTLAPNEVIPKAGEELAGRLRAWLTDGAPATDTTEDGRARLAALRARVRTGLTNIGLSESHSRVAARMREQYGETKLERLTEEQLTDFDRYINSVADRQASKQSSHIKAVS